MKYVRCALVVALCLAFGLFFGSGLSHALAGGGGKSHQPVSLNKHGDDSQDDSSDDNGGSGGSGDANSGNSGRGGGQDDANDDHGADATETTDDSGSGHGDADNGNGNDDHGADATETGDDSGNGHGQAHGHSQDDNGQGNNGSSDNGSGDHGNSGNASGHDDDSGTPEAKHASKVLVCHVTGLSDYHFNLIEISQHAWPAHERHGDFLAPADATSSTDCEAAANAGTPSASPAAPGTPVGSPEALGHKVRVCHVTSSAKNPVILISIDQHAWPAHEAHGDFLAPDDARSSNDCEAGLGTPVASPVASPEGSPEAATTG
jgi:hypothetical protein